MPRRLGSILIFFYLGLSGLVAGQVAPSPAPKADTSDEAFVFERISELIRFESDGTGVRDTTAVIRVQSQAGMKAFGQLVFGYSSATEHLDVDYVRVRKADGRVVATPAANAQDFAPDILREAPMYSDYRQRHVSVVDLRPGDVLEYHTIIHVTTPLAPNQFWYEHSFPRQVALGEGRLEIDLPKSREVKLKSPGRKFEVHESGDRRIYTWVVHEPAPDRKRARDEDDFDDQPDVQLSSFGDWLQVAHWYSKLQGDRVVVDENIRQKAAELTRGAGTPPEKARRLYEYVAGNIRYVSLSFGVGRLQPHTASEVLQNGFGDCKDKHTLLQALLRAADIPSYPVLINSYRKIDPDVPSPSQFDHEITAVRLGKGEDLTWLDSTTEVAPYGLILYQLRNKQALLASDDSYAGLRLTASDSPVKNVFTIKMDGKFSETGALDTNFDLTAQGDSEVPLRMAFRQTSPAQWQQLLEAIVGAWGFQEGDVSEIHLDPIENTSKALHLTYHFHKDNFFIVPTSGVSFGILPPLLPLARVPKSNPHKGPEPLSVGPAIEQIFRAHIEFPANYTVTIPGGVRMVRDYGEYSSSYALANNRLDGERRMVLKVSELPPARRSDYESFRNTGGDGQPTLSCSIAPASSAAVAKAATVDGTAEELRKAGSAALQRKDFNSAADLLKRSLDKDSSQKDGWEDLGLAYAALYRHEEAATAFRKQIEQDAFHPRANGDLGAELQEQSKFEEAVAAYRKQIEVTPGDKTAHKSLGLLLVQMHHEADALPELETAASIPPDDPELKLALARLYTKNGDTQRAEALMKSVTGAASQNLGSDLYVAALRDDINPNQTEHDARQTLDNIGDQFDSGEFDRLGPSAFSAMNLVALAWARMGWAKFLQGETLEAMQFLNASWTLCQSGTVGNRLARLLEKEGQRDKARRMYALAVAAGGADAETSRQSVTRLATGPAAGDQEIAQASVELLQARTVSLPSIAPGTVSATFALVFDSSTKPERADFLNGDPSLSNARAQLQQKDYPVKFPDVSSVKLIRRAKLSCSNSKCSVELLPPEPMAAGGSPSAATKAPRK